MIVLDQPTLLDLELSTSVAELVSHLSIPGLGLFEQHLRPLSRRHPRTTSKNVSCWHNGKLFITVFRCILTFLLRKWADHVLNSIDFFLTFSQVKICLLLRDGMEHFETTHIHSC